MADPGREPVYMARQHHDFQRQGSSVGHYYPGGEPWTDHGNTLILTHENLYNHDISDKRLIDGKIGGLGGQHPLDLAGQRPLRAACRVKPIPI